MKKILMILTSHRLDCFRLCIDMLVSGGSAARFDRVVILCSGVEGRHRRYVESLPIRFPEVSWAFLWGPRGRGKPISDMQNECVRRYPDSLYFKIDEDTFVSGDWDREIVRAYEQFQHDPDLSLLTAVVTNNQRGAYHLLTTFPELGNEFIRRFRKPIVTDRMGPIWLFPQCAEFMIRRFLNLDRANEELRARQQTGDQLVRRSGRSRVGGRPETGDIRPETTDQRPETIGNRQQATDQRPETLAFRSETTDPLPHGSCRESAAESFDKAVDKGNDKESLRSSVFGLESTYPTFSYPFSINCIAYDYRHWQEIGGVPEQDENGWGEWIPAHGKKVVLVTRAIAHHYAFFVQQKWLDRTSLLEDIRKANLPKTHRPVVGRLAHARRIAVQVPGAIAARLGVKTEV